MPAEMPMPVMLRTSISTQERKLSISALTGLQRGLVDGDDRVDFRLERLAVGAVGLIVALLAGGLGADLGTEAGRFRAEGAEFRSAGDKLGKTVLLILGNERRPARDDLVDLVEAGQQALGKIRRILDRLGGINAARFHHHGRHETVETFAGIGAGGGLFVSRQVATVFVHRGQCRCADQKRDRAHHAHQQINFATDLQCNALLATPLPGKQIPAHALNIGDIY